jgi:MarR family transcriptional regulator, organic hydroperoxide resistance regulator
MKTSESKFAGCLYFAANALARKMDKMAQECWGRLGLVPSHAYVVMLVLENPGIQPSAVADQLQLQPSTITRFIEKMEEKKLLIRTSEGKITNIYPTPKAKEMFPKMKEYATEFSARSASFLGKEESHKLLQIMGKMADKLTS